MPQKSTQALPWIVGIFVGGIALSAIGLTKGRDIASFFSRPGGAAVWTISENMILGWTYLPLMIGVLMMVLSMVFVTVLFIHWLKEPVTAEPGTGTGNAQAAK